MINKLVKTYPWFSKILERSELQDILLRNLYCYYLTNNNIHIILPIISSNSDISIRVIDWFVTNYSKKNNIIYKLYDYSDNNRFFNIYLQYKCQLKSYKKKLFDPFCRKNKIPFYYDENKCVITTVGQLNFFKWAIDNFILDYIKNNLSNITEDMINTNKSLAKNKKLINEISVEKPNSLIITNKDEENFSLKDCNIIKLNNLLNNELFNSYKNISSKDSMLNSNCIIDGFIIKNPETFSTMEISTSSESDKLKYYNNQKNLKRRHQLSNSINNSVNIHNYKITLYFE